MTAKTMPLNLKILVLVDLSAGLTATKISEKYQISIEQILLTAGNELSILELFRSEYYKMALVMPLKTGSYPRMENILYQWYLQNPGNYKNPNFIEKARNVIAITEEQPSRGSRVFSGSMSWVTGFKKRYNITLDKVVKKVVNNSNRTLNEKTEKMVKALSQIKEEESNDNVGLFHSSSMLEVEINENITSQPIQNETPEINQNIVLNTTPIQLADGGANNSLKLNVKQLPMRTRRLTTMKPNWALQVFSQALKWTKENPTDEDDVRVLRKLHNRCVMSMNHTRNIKTENP